MQKMLSSFGKTFQDFRLLFSPLIIGIAALWLPLSGGGTLYGQQPFITTWKTNNSGSSNSTSITIPTNGGGYNYEVDWNNDGTYEQTGITGDVTHNFGVAGTYTIRIRGVFPRIFSGSGDSQKLLNVNQWGSNAWTSMNNAFANCSYLQISATDVPNLTGVNDMSFMFASCASLNSPANIGTWNTSTVTDMNFMFLQAIAFNQPIGTWNTAAVTNMSRMFYSATAFNQPIGTWNTTAVTNMNALFFNATAFNQPIGTWKTAAVTDMMSMFGGATAFNQPIGTWNTAAVTNMNSMFGQATAFNQLIGTWNTAAVTNMNRMFYGATAFNKPIGTWNTNSVTNMGLMFYGASSFNQPIGTWNTNSVTDMTGMFSQASLFNQDIGTWTLKPAVDLTLLLNESGMDCDNYSATLVGWRNNPATPNGLALDGSDRQYGTNAVAARTYLITNKGWFIGGDTPSGAACPAPLPVEWLTFTGKQQENSVLLTWQTAQEKQNLGFEVERSTDGARWEQIGFVPAKNNLTEVQTYTFRDERAPEQCTSGCALYYRLRQKESSGGENLSKVVSVKLAVKGGLTGLQVFPNPVSDGTLTLVLPEDTAEEMTVHLLNVTGQTLLSTVLKGGTMVWNISDLTPGIYTIAAQGRSGQFFEKIVVER